MAPIPFFDFRKIPLRRPDRDAPLQAKLEVGAVDDPLEREADRIADQVVDGSAPTARLTPSAAPPSSGALQRKCKMCEVEEEYLQRNALPGAPGPRHAPPVVDAVVKSLGQPLDAPTRAFMESRFGASFGDVRVHVDGNASQSASAVSARAYTVGHDIVFGEGRYDPTSAEGRRLLAHELAHVVQQRGGIPALRRKPDLEGLQAAVRPPYDFPKAAEILNGFSPDDMASALTKFSRGIVGSIYAGAVANPRVGPDSAIAAATRATYLDLNYKNSLALHAWAQAAEFLNGFNREDVLARLHRLNAADLRALHDGAVQNPAVGDHSQVAELTGTLLAHSSSGPATPAPACAAPFRKAGSFVELVALLRAAEKKLSAGGIAAAKDQIHALRGLYYGTTWSTDFSVEKSTTRNEGFQRFTRPSQDPASSVPMDARGLLDCELADALKDSQDLVDPAGRHVDFGHLIIGLDARFDVDRAKNVKYPAAFGISVDLGGTGTELVTWLGDLGGGAASLATRRVAAPGTSARAVFTGSDYGGSINLEGDVAASVVATSSATAVTEPSIPPGKGLADVVEDYLAPTAAGTKWKERAATFLRMSGATFDASNALTNRNALVDAFAAKIEVFACNYLASRVKDGKLPLATATGAADQHVVSSAREVATAFIDALDDSRKTGARIEATRFPAPSAGGTSACSAQLAAARLLRP